MKQVIFEVQRRREYISRAGVKKFSIWETFGSQFDRYLTQEQAEQVTTQARETHKGSGTEFRIVRTTWKALNF